MPKLGGSHFLALHFHPGVAVVGLDDLVGHHAHVLLDHIVRELAPDEALYGGHGIGGIGDCLPLGGLSHQDLSVLGKGNDRRRRPIALTVLDDLGLPPSMIATQELVVPRSMPIILPMMKTL